MSTFAKKFYNSKAWKTFREMYFLKMYGLCERCMAKGLEVPGEEVHHMIYLTPSNIDDPLITLNEDNCELLCKNCHNAEHEKTYAMHRRNKVKNYKSGDDKYKFVDGELVINKNVNIVHGAPASGKTTYVKKHMGKYDVVFDFDYIRMALMLSTEKPNTPDTIKYAIDMRDVFYQAVEERRHYSESIWIIVTMPKGYERRRLAERLKANLIHIDTDEQNCLDRAKNDINRYDKEKQSVIIERYFKDYEQ